MSSQCNFFFRSSCPPKCQVVRIQQSFPGVSSAASFCQQPGHLTRLYSSLFLTGSQRQRTLTDGHWLHDGCDSALPVTRDGRLQRGKPGTRPCRLLRSRMHTRVTDSMFQSSTHGTSTRAPALWTSRAHGGAEQSRGTRPTGQHGLPEDLTPTPRTGGHGAR